MISFVIAAIDAVLSIHPIGLDDSAQLLWQIAGPHLWPLDLLAKAAELPVVGGVFTVISVIAMTVFGLLGSVLVFVITIGSSVLYDLALAVDPLLFRLEHLLIALRALGIS